MASLGYPLRRPCHAIRAVESWSRARHARTCATTAAAVAVPRALTTMAARRLRSCSFSLSSSPCRAAFHSSPPREKRATAHNNEEVPEGPPTTDFGRMDVLGNTPVPSTSVDFCMSDGFQLNSGTKILGGDGVLLIGGQAFAWRPWGPGKTFVNAKGQWEVDNGAFGLLGLVWPRPDLLILGLGSEIRPLSPETKRHITSLGMRVEVLDTRNAASQFNLLATERGVDDVAAALIPIGWREGIGAR